MSRQATEMRGRANQNASPAASEEDDGVSAGIGVADEDVVQEELAPSSGVSTPAGDGPTDATPRAGAAHTRPSGPSGVCEGIGSRKRPSGDRRADTTERNRAQGLTPAETDQFIRAIAPVLSEVLDRLEYMERRFEPTDQPEGEDEDPSGPHNADRGFSIDPEQEPFDGDDSNSQISGKGKGVDPGNWSGIDIPESELDAEIQHVRFNELANAAKAAEANKENIPPQVDERTHEEHMNFDYAAYIKEKRLAESKNLEKPGARADRIYDNSMSRDVEMFIAQEEGTPFNATKYAKLLPSKQLHPTSLVGKQLAGPEGRTTASAFGLAQTPNRSKIDIEMNDMFGMSEDTAETPLAPIPPTRFRPLAPTTPTIYHGDEDPMKFFKYVSQCKRFTREAQLPLTDQVARCGDYLGGKAYKYYTTMVSMDESNWLLLDFFRGLYDYCFPPDYHLRQRERLEGLYQGAMSVTEYAAELNLLYRLMGTSTVQMRVDKLWNGLRSELQTALWKEGLDFKENSWEEIITVATKHEMADRMEAANKRSRNGNNSQSNFTKNNHNTYDSKCNDNKAFKSHNNFKSDSNNTKKPYGNKGTYSKESGSAKSSGSYKDHKKSYDGGGSSFKKSSEPKSEHELRTKCHNCAVVGHYQRHCPDAQGVRTGKPNDKKAPGIKLHNIEVFTETEECLSAMMDSTQKPDDAQDEFYIGVESAMLHTLFLEDTDEEDSSCEGKWDFSDEESECVAPTLLYRIPVTSLPTEDVVGRLGQPVSTLIMRELENARPYPGDPEWECEEEY